MLKELYYIDSNHRDEVMIYKRNSFLYAVVGTTTYFSSYDERYINEIFEVSKMRSASSGVAS